MNPPRSEGYVRMPDAEFEAIRPVCAMISATSASQE
jgi:hypothetical protein